MQTSTIHLLVGYNAGCILGMQRDSARRPFLSSLEMSSRRILIADDSQIARSGISLLIRLSNEPWEVCGEAENGQAAVEQAGQLLPDLVILDMIMPRMDGIAAGRKIRALLPEVPIILYSLLDTEPLEPMAIQAGIDRVVNKSDVRGLVAAIRAAFHNGRS